MPKVTTAKEMFYGCSNLDTFSSDLSSLRYGDYMFYNCSKLAIFDPKALSSLTEGDYMFQGC